MGFVDKGTIRAYSTMKNPANLTAELLLTALGGFYLDH